LHKSKEKIGKIFGENDEIKKKNRNSFSGGIRALLFEFV
jgi:hypothetical protein